MLYNDMVDRQCVTDAAGVEVRLWERGLEEAAGAVSAATAP